MAPVPPSASASYKKKDGTLAISSDLQSITWTPKAGPDGSFTLQTAPITNLQQTPVNNPKVMLKIFIQAPNQSQGQENAAPVPYVFTFTSPSNARPEADAIKAALNTVIQATKVAQTPARDGTPAALAAAKPPWYDDARLKGDMALQQSLLNSNESLKRVFAESLRTKPASVTHGQLVSQFWSSRIHLLRAHAIEKSQEQGAYNVLSTVKPRMEDKRRLNLSKEQIQLIFSQHPLVKKVYDENVPKVAEEVFWSQFFQSRLFKKLRGERITDTDPTDSLLDKYLKFDENTGRPAADAERIPHLIDLEGNEEHNSQRQGNRPNFDMRPTSVDKVPIIRTLNTLSEKIMKNVAPADQNLTYAEDADDEMYNELQLRDLREDEEQRRIMLNIRDQSRFFSEGQGSEVKDVRVFANQDPAASLNMLQSEFNHTYMGAGQVRLSRLVEPEDDDSSDDDPKKPKKEPVGSKASLASAKSQIFEMIGQRKAQADPESSSNTCGLSQTVFDRLTLTHATTTEFLTQFWQAFLSGNPDRASEIASMVESLNRAMDRINEVSKTAEAERQVEVDKLRKHAREVMASTGKRIRPNDVDGGEKVVKQLMGPTINALAKATAEYQKALAQQSGEGQP
ncbi:RNA polymerase II transcription factor B subunit 1 [Arthroderma uncinatum]|uniref:RNA polymerase II transcription factor B subunit 1 n=1 Tax=Arthroderma uncinatum TaxID=74035 RepID=UPI00144A9CBF|nr:RNA polymerase II transcription factor B subunit 1 [Arthroderma uncinatum]KAF3481420.1 RNA polymerase II transcription factor B subunit 1 [Arthroderma uncinatum]